jgi:hypothetical protein
MTQFGYGVTHQKSMELDDDPEFGEQSKMKAMNTNMLTSSVT